MIVEKMWMLLRLIKMLKLIEMFMLKYVGKITLVVEKM